jgi:protein tyrosine phosphatase
MIFYSAGCGRTGTFCTIDTVMELLKKPDAFDYHEALLLQIMETFRTQRMQTVQRGVSSNEL